MPMIVHGKAPAFRKFAKRAGAVVLALIALDLVAAAATFAFGWEMFGR